MYFNKLLGDQSRINIEFTYTHANLTKLKEKIHEKGAFIEHISKDDLSKYGVDGIVKNKALATKLMCPEVY